LQLICRRNIASLERYLFNEKGRTFTITGRVEGQHLIVLDHSDRTTRQSDGILIATVVSWVRGGYTPHIDNIIFFANL